MHQHLAQGQAQAGHGFHAFGKGVLESTGTTGDGHSDLLGQGIFFDDLVEGVDKLAVFLFLDHLDLVFLEPFGDGHADRHQLEL